MTRDRLNMPKPHTSGGFWMFWFTFTEEFLAEKNSMAGIHTQK